MTDIKDIHCRNVAVTRSPNGSALSLADAWQALLERRSNSVDGKTPNFDEADVESRELWECLSPLAAQPTWVVAQLGQSLDGRIATESGHSHYINGQESLVHLHRLRALCDAVLIGAGTACADDPQLTVRHVEGPHPVRVVLDPRGRVPHGLALFKIATAPTLHLVGPAAPASPVASHVERRTLALNTQGQFAAQDVVDLLKQLGHRRLLVEGGGVTVSHFIESGVVDRLHMLVAPLLIGSGRPGLRMTPIETLDTALRPPARTFRCGEDTLFDLELTARC
ncbi:RibD family protein [Halomonas dongshanensis]|uniref:RibD family protein n=1 Tax=Halomonas dongshanensis TaxID=2890835 RepID=A0ABT2ED71_9GAMM|nr:RibD family protein [Halomonas dongshanensis]MCS2609536.1 RibD family protein [Halomonas dongshanensis]